MQALPPPQQAVPAMLAEEAGDYGLTPSALATHAANLVISKALFANPPLLLQTVANAAGALSSAAVAEGAAPVNGNSPLSVLRHVTANGGGVSAFVTRGVAAELALSVPSFANHVGAEILTTMVLGATEALFSSIGGDGSSVPEISITSPPPSAGPSVAAVFTVLVMERALRSLFAVPVAAPRDTILTHLHCDVSWAGARNAAKKKEQQQASKSKSRVAASEQSHATPPIASATAAPPEATSSGHSSPASASPPTAAQPTAARSVSSRRYGGTYCDAWACARALWRGGGVASFYRGWWLAPLSTAVEHTAYYGVIFASSALRWRFYYSGAVAAAAAAGGEGRGPIAKPLITPHASELGALATTTVALVAGALVVQPLLTLRTRMLLSARSAPPAATATAARSADAAGGSEEVGADGTSSTEVNVASVAAEGGASASQPFGSFGSVSECARRIVAEEGGWPALWQGIGVSLFRIAADAASNFLLG